MQSSTGEHHASDRVVIAVDPHKASWTAVVVGGGLAGMAALRVEVGRGGYRQLRRFAAGWPQAIWAIEGATGLGAPLTEHLRADGITVQPGEVQWVLARVILQRVTFRLGRCVGGRSGRRGCPSGACHQHH
jgi:hypothetical protein